MHYLGKKTITAKCELIRRSNESHIFANTKSLCDIPIVNSGALFGAVQSRVTIGTPLSRHM